MATATAGLDLLTVPRIAAESGAAVWAVRQVLDRLGIAARVGRHRVIERGDLPLVVAELDRRGYLDHGQGEPRPGASA